LQTLGSVVRFGSHKEWAVALFDLAVIKAHQLEFPRAWAFALMGLRDYNIAMNHPRELVALQKKLLGKLVALYKQNHVKGDWEWFEDELTYENGILSQAVIATAKVLDDAEAMKIGLTTLKWLYEQQVLGDFFSPIGNRGWFKRPKSLAAAAATTPPMSPAGGEMKAWRGTMEDLGDQKAVFDQQPMNVCGMVLACASSFSATKDPAWRTRARHCFDWFMGRNIHGKPLFDPKTGGCLDGLHERGANGNQGAESLLSLLQALVALTTEERKGDPVPEGTEVATPVSTFTTEVKSFPVR